MVSLNVLCSMRKMNKFNIFLFFNLFLVLSFVNTGECLFRFDDDYNEFDTSFADPHVDIQRNVKPITPHLHDHHSHKIGDSFDFDHHEHYKNDAQFKDDFKRDPFKHDSFESDVFRRDPFKGDFFTKNDRFKDDLFKKDEFKIDQFKNDFKNDEIKNDLIKSDIMKPDRPPATQLIPKPVQIRKKQAKNDNFNKSDSLINEFNSNFDDVNRIPDFDFHEHDAWFEQNRDFDIPRRDRIVSDKLINDYRQPTPRTPFRVPMIPVPTFYPHPFPILPTPFIPQPPLIRPQPQPPQQQNQQQQNRPPRPPSNSQTNNLAPNLPGWFYPYYPYPMMPVMPHSIPNQANSANSGNSNNVQLQNAIQSMMNRNSFLGFVDPLIIVAIIAIPVIAMLGFSSVIMPFIPVIIYVLNIFFPISASSGRRRRKKRSISVDDFCTLFRQHFTDDSSPDLWPDLMVKDHQFLYETKFNELEAYLRHFHRSICHSPI